MIAETVAAPLEQALNGVEDMLYMLSGNSSTSSSLTIAMTFAVGTDPDIALINVQNRVQSAIQLLPEEVRRQGVSIQKALPSFLMILSFDSPDGRYDDLFVSNYATLNVIDELRRIPGMGNVQVFGARDYSIRIWLRPDKLAELGLTPADVADAVREQNAQSAAGRLGDEPIDEHVDLTLSVTTQSRLSDPEQFERIVLRAGDNGEIVRLARRGARRARRTRLRVRALAAGKARDRRGAPARTRRERARVRGRRLREDGGARAELSGGARVVDSVRHEQVRAHVDARGRVHVLRGARARVLRRLAVSLQPARDGDPVGRRARVARRHVRGHVPARLLDQLADAVRHGARDRHRRRRRYRRARERRAAHARRARRRARGDAPRDGRGQPRPSSRSCSC